METDKQDFAWAEKPVELAEDARLRGEIQDLSRKQLQSLAKKYGMKGNAKTSALVEQLNEVKDAVHLAAEGRDLLRSLEVKIVNCKSNLTKQCI